MNKNTDEHHITSNDLYRTHDKLIKLKKESYDKIFTRCINSIKLTAKAGELICIYNIPNFLWGSCYPIIDVKSCARYLIKKLRKSNSNIRVNFIKPDILFIDWRK